MPDSSDSLGPENGNTEEGNTEESMSVPGAGSSDSAGTVAAVGDSSPDGSLASASPHGAKAIGIKKALVIIALMWAIVIVPGKIVPLTMLHFVSMQFGPVLGFLALAIWWFLSRRLPRRERFVGFALVLGGFIAAMMVAHPSLRILMLVYGLPVALTILVGLLAVSGSVVWSRRRWIGYAGFAAFLVAAQFVRVGRIDGAFAFDLVSRWKPTAEEDFLATLEQSPAPELEPSAWDLPAQPSDSDWGEFRGPLRDGVARGVAFDGDWDAHPPSEKWRRAVGPAWSSFCVVAPLFYTQEQRGEIEVVSAYELATGEPVWTHENPGRFEASMGGIGPRATPTYDNGDLFVTGANGRIECLDPVTGESRWTYDLIEELQAPLPAWGFSSSPLVVDNPAGDPAGLVLVFVGAGEGKGVVALDRSSGQEVWTNGVGSHGYSSPHRATIDGVDQVLIASNVGVESLDAQTGKSLWLHEWDIGEMARVTQPLLVDHSVFLGTGYGNGTQRIDVSRDGDSWTLDERWTANLKPYFNDFVFFDGHLYGFDGPIFMCVEVESGDKAWKRGRYGHGQVLLVEDMALLVIITEKGELVLVDANGEEWNERAKIQAVDGVTWNHPVIADNLLLVRNADEMVAYELAPKP